MVRCTNDQNDLETMWYIYTMEFHSATSKDILLFATTWMDLEHVCNVKLLRQRKTSMHGITNMWGLKNPDS